ncbi:MAG: hypothetical protein WC026_13195 [Hyphomicrobium sp.]|uniref:hypothetical protein n=1 Tax=Hyphomicrobium sp. TaxID=82 RepID=UPI00356A8D5D
MKTQYKLHLIKTLNPSNLIIEDNEFDKDFGRLLFSEDCGIKFFDEHKNHRRTNKHFLIIADNLERKKSDWNKGDFFRCGSVIVELDYLVGSEEDYCLYGNDDIERFSFNAKKIIASNSKEITPNSLINKEDIVIITDYYNTHEKLPEIDLETFEEEEHIGGSGHTAYPTFTTKIKVNDNNVVINWKKDKTEEEMYELEQQLDIPHKDRFYNSKPDIKTIERLVKRGEMRRLKNDIDEICDAAVEYTSNHKDFSAEGFSEYMNGIINGFSEGAEWMKKKTHANEEVISILYKHTEYIISEYVMTGKPHISIEKWFEQFKK